MAQDPRHKYYETQAFKELNAKWRDKLEADGFEDIERDDGELQNFSTQFAKNPEYNRSKEEYYRLAGHFLHDYKFSNDAEKRVWELHIGGMSTREIALKMPRSVSRCIEPRNTSGGFATNLKKVKACVRRLAKVMIDRCNKK